jgi:hypothetical protein
VKRKPVGVNAKTTLSLTSFVKPQTKRVKTTIGYRSLEAMRVACRMVARGTLVLKGINFLYSLLIPVFTHRNFPLNYVT